MRASSATAMFEQSYRDVIPGKSGREKEKQQDALGGL